ncbi:hypothetical protein V6N11_042238 [Hibiscus sabdariffa]|uniref:Secreted protein n=1 Tax=Hibiscus sabdariffa TaxID=183260 RepID=A0ABR2QVT4_9ROSI
MRLRSPLLWPKLLFETSACGEAASLVSVARAQNCPDDWDQRDARCSPDMLPPPRPRTRPSDSRSDDWQLAAD